MMEQTYPTATARTTTPVIGGILSIVSAGITLLFVLIPFIITHSDYLSGSTYFLAFHGLRIAWLISSILAILGGILAIRREEWRLALIGVIASIFTLPALLGIVATILVAVSKKEFS